MRYKLLKNIIIVGCFWLLSRLAFADVNCADLATDISNFSQTIWWKYNADKSYMKGKDAKLTSDPSSFEYIKPSYKISVWYYNSRKEDKLTTYTVFNSGVCNSPGVNAQGYPFCNDFVPDGGEVTLMAWREKDGRSHDTSTIHIQGEGRVDDGREYAQFYDKDDGTCSPNAGWPWDPTDSGGWLPWSNPDSGAWPWDSGQGDKPTEAKFNLLDPLAQEVSVNVDYTSPHLAAAAATKAYSLIDPKYIADLNQRDNAPISVLHDDGSSQVTYVFNRNCSASLAEEGIAACEKDGGDPDDCFKAACYYPAAASECSTDKC